MEFVKGYIKQPEKYRRGIFNISPFVTDDIFRNNYIWRNYRADSNPFISLNGLKLSITDSATEALDLILSELNLSANDELWIVTTSGNKYISSCVTGTIEKHCKWSRSYGSATAAILVNHEFGFISSEVEELSSLGLPVIEDAAYSMYSEKAGKKPGELSDYAFFSMAKMFPMQAGGLLYSKKGSVHQASLSAEAASYFKSCFSFYDKYRKHIINSRLDAFRLYKESFSREGFKPRFEPRDGEVPGAFVFEAKGVDLDGLKEFLQGHGIECSVFYGEEAFYLPCHQNISQQHIDYFLCLIKDYLK